MNYAHYNMIIFIGCIDKTWWDNYKAINESTY